jgi:8-oxo-dGTP diphosphatase
MPALWYTGHILFENPLEGQMGRDNQGIAQSHGRYQVIPRVLCFVTHGDEVLMLRGGPHKRLWAGLYNGVGGHVEPGEDIRAAVRREVKEETGLDVGNVRLRGVVHVDVDDPTRGVLFFVFTATAPGKEVVQTSAGTLEWLHVQALPSAHLVEDLPVILPMVLAMGPAAPPFFAMYSYDAEDRLVICFSHNGDLPQEPS